MKNGVMRRQIWVVGFALIILLIGSSFVANGQEKESGKSFFQKSLHSTGEGMRYWYEEHNGFIDYTHIPYDELDCKNCHVKTCDSCHAEKRGETHYFSVAKAYETDTCLTCHKRAGLSFKLGKKKGALDVHIESGMTCADCHVGQDVHGDGTFYNSMRDPEALKVSCMTCHTSDITIRDHTIHRDKLDCNACHVENSIACMNCHFDTFLKTGKRQGNFLPMQNWLLLINYQGKVTSGTAMSLVYQDKKFLSYTPYFTHAIQKKGRGCNDCHGNAAVKMIKEGKSVPMMTFKDGKVINWEGVVPLVPDKLEWVFLNKNGEKWTPIQSKEPIKIQFAGYGEPLTKEQIDKLAEEPIVLISKP